MSPKYAYAPHPSPQVPSLQQRKVIAFIDECLAGGVSPSPEDIRVHMGWKNASSALDCLRRIISYGLLPAGYDRRRLPPSFERVLEIYEGGSA